MALTTKVVVCCYFIDKLKWSKSFNHKLLYFKLGRQFDKEGNMKQWWNNATITAFRQRAQCIIDQYSRYKVNELGLYMNGK